MNTVKELQKINATIITETPNSMKNMNNKNNNKMIAIKIYIPLTHLNINGLNFPS